LRSGPRPTRCGRDRSRIRSVGFRTLLVDNGPIYRIDRALDLLNGIAVQEFDGSGLETVDYLSASADEFVAQYE